MVARRATWLAALLLPLALQAATAEPPASVLSPDEANAELKLENVDEGIGNLRQAPWRLLQVLGHPAADETGRRVEDDLAEYVLTEPVLARISAMREALAASAKTGTTITVAKAQPLQHLVQAEFCRLMVVSAYWNKRRARQFHQDMIESLLTRVREQDRPAALLALRAIDAHATSSRALIAPAMQYCEGTTVTGLSLTAPRPSIFDRDPLLADYNALRMKLVAPLNALRQSGAADLISVRRTTPCPAPATTTTGQRTPAIRSQPDVRDYYPPDALKFLVEGLSNLRLFYDATGCVVEAAILSSTGSDLLDEASIRFGFACALTPGEENGKRIDEGGVILPIRFQVMEWPPDGEAVSQPQP